MTFSVSVVPFENQFLATIIGDPDIRATGQTREAAVAALKAEVTERLGRGELAAINVEEDGLLGLAGKYRDDPTLQQICAEAYRERDSEIVE